MMEYDGPVYFRVPKVETPVLFKEDYKFQWAKGMVLKEGKDITLMGTGMMTGVCVRAAEILANEDISAEVIHMPSIKPIDEELIIKTARKTGCILTIENGRTIGGFGSAVCEIINREYPVFVHMMGIGDNLIMSAPLSDLMKAYKLTPKDIVNKSKSIISKKSISSFNEKK
jgi:transketolase